MLMAIDVGNTQIVVGLFDDNGSVGTGELVHQWRVATHPVYTADEFALQLSQLLALDGLDFSTVTGAVIACVVPPLQTALRDMLSRRLKVPSVFVEPGVRTGMPVLVDNPKEVGADRIADAVAAFERYGGPTIVVDFGTATNFEVVSAKGEYLGGVLFPGVELSFNALTARAALLSRVDMAPPADHPGQEHCGTASVRHLLRFRLPGRRGLRQAEGRGGPGHRGGHGRLGADHRAGNEGHRLLRALADPVRPAHHLPPEPHRWLRTSLPVRSYGDARPSFRSASPTLAPSEGSGDGSNGGRADHAAAGDGKADLPHAHRLDRLGAIVRGRAMDRAVRRAQQAFPGGLGWGYRGGGPHQDGRTLGAS